MHLGSPPSDLTAVRKTRHLTALATVLLLTAATLAVLTLGAAPPAHAKAEAQATSAPTEFDQKILKWTNVARKKNGRRPVKMATCPDGYAESWTRRMAATDNFAHQDLGPIMENCDFGAAGENIAMSSGHVTARRVVRMWLKSPGHRKILLTRKYRRIGIATWISADTGNYYYTQDFGG